MFNTLQASLIDKCNANEHNTIPVRPALIRCTGLGMAGTVRARTRAHSVRKAPIRYCAQHRMVHVNCTRTRCRRAAMGIRLLPKAAAASDVNQNHTQRKRGFRPIKHNHFQPVQKHSDEKPYHVYCLYITITFN